MLMIILKGCVLYRGHALNNNCGGPQARAPGAHTRDDANGNPSARTGTISKGAAHRRPAGAAALLERVAGLLDLLVGVDLLPLLAQRGDLLLDLLELRLGDLLERLLLLDLVAKRVELLVLVERLVLLGLLLRLGARLLRRVHPLGARHGALAVDDRPHLGAERRVELALVRDDDDAAEVVL